MAKTRLYRAYFNAPNGKDGYTLVKADNPKAALYNAKRIGVKGTPNAKFTSVKFMRWVSE